MTKETKPLCYLDVDGVLNVYGYSGADYEDCKVVVGALPDPNPKVRFEGLRQTEKTEWNCIVPPYVARNVARLREHFQMVWCTAWRGSAHVSWRELLSLPEDSWEYIDYSDMKLPELLRHAGDRRWVYLDDEAAWEVLRLLDKRPPVAPEDLEWPNGRVFNVDATVGLDDALTERVIAWANDG